MMTMVVRGVHSSSSSTSSSSLSLGFPQCLDRSLVMVLLNAIQQSPRNRPKRYQQQSLQQQQQQRHPLGGGLWSPSQFVLLTAIQTILQRSPQATNALPGFLNHPVLLSTPSTPTTTASALLSSPNAVNRSLSVLSYLVTMNDDDEINNVRNVVDDGQKRQRQRSQRCDHMSVVGEREILLDNVISACFNLLRRIDEMDSLSNHNNNDNSNNNKLQSSTVMATTRQQLQGLYRNTKRQHKRMTLSDLLDESMNNDESNNNGLPYPTSYHSQYSNDSWMAAAMMNDATTTGGGGGTVALVPNQWPTVRSRLYKKLTTFLTQQQQFEPPNGSSDRHYHHQTIHMVLRESVASPQSSSFRVCLLLFVATATASTKTTAVPSSTTTTHNRFQPSTMMILRPETVYPSIANICWKNYVRTTTSTYVAATNRTTGTYDTTRTQPHTQQQEENVWLRTYTEWIGECSFFDHNRTICWKCFKPLVLSMQQQQQQQDINEPGNDCDRMNGSENHHENESISGSNNDRLTEQQKQLDLQQLLASVGYILSRRSRLFQHCSNGTRDQIQIEFEDFVNYLSIHFGDSPRSWFALVTEPTKQQMIQSTLQRLQIFGLSGIHTNDDTYETTQTKPGSGSSTLKTSPYRRRHEALQCWPFAERYSLRNGIESLDVHEFSAMEGIGRVDRLLSCSVEQVVEDFTDLEDIKQTKQPMHTKPSVPILDGIHHNVDMFSHIFSFCDFRSLCNVVQVCKNWKEVVDKDSNVLWQGVYLGKYPAIDRGVRLQLATAAELCAMGADKRQWKSIFRTKYFAENTLANQRNTWTGYKYRTCPVLGCLCVIKGSDQERKHLLMHERKNRKAQGTTKKKKKKTTSLKKRKTMPKKKEA